MDTAEQKYDDLKEISLSSDESSADAVKRPFETEHETEKLERSESASKRAKLEAQPEAGQFDDASEGSEAQPSPEGSSTPTATAAVVDYLAAKRAELGTSPPTGSSAMSVMATIVSDGTGDSCGGSSGPVENSEGQKSSSPPGSNDNDVIINSRSRNVQYLRMIKENRTAYARASTRGERKALVGSLMSQWRRKGGRFLTRQKGAEVEADDETVEKKITAALRKPKAKKKVAVVPLRPGRHVLPQLGVVPQRVFLASGPEYDADEAARIFLVMEDERAARKAAAKESAAASGSTRGEGVNDGQPSKKSKTRTKSAKKVRLSILETSTDSGGGGDPAGAAKTPKASASSSRSPSAPRTPALLLSEEPAPSLGDGWVTKTFRRTSGKTSGTTDVYFYSPATAIKFRSLKNCRLFIGVLAEEAVGGDERAALKVYKERGHKF